MNENIIIVICLGVNGLGLIVILCLTILLQILNKRIQEAEGMRAVKEFAEKLKGISIRLYDDRSENYIEAVGVCAIDNLIKESYGDEMSQGEPAQGATVDGDKVAFCNGIITIICDDTTEGNSQRVKKLYYSLYDKAVTLNDCLKIIEFDGEGTVMVIFEEPLHGEIYEYGNYAEKCWVKYGTTKGYA